MSEAKTKLKGFDGMRAIACLAVLFHHLFQRLGIDSAVRTGFELGEVGVSLFFVLSGALLSYPFWRNYMLGNSMPSLTHYLIHRAARIVPGFYLALLVSFTVGIMLVDVQYSWERLAAGLLFIAPYHYITFFPTDLDPPLWSIGLEVSCYCLLPLLLFPVWRRASGNILLALGALLGVIALLQLAHGVIVDVFMTDENQKGWRYGLIGGAKQWLPYWNIAGFMGQFLCGSFAALGIAALQDRKWPRDNILFDLLAFIALAVIFIVIGLFHHAGYSSGFAGQPYLAPGFAFICAVVLFALHFSRYLGDMLDNGFFKHVATLSFGLYLWHYVVMEVIKHAWEPEFTYFGMTDWIYWLELCFVVCLVSWLIASLSYFLLEAPVLRCAREFTRRSKRSIDSTDKVKRIESDSVKLTSS